MKNILKLFVISVIILNSIVMLSQGNKAKYFSKSFIGLSLVQDAKLALIEDDHGNKPFTSDFTLKAMFQGFEGKYGSLAVGGKFRYTDLVDKGYVNYATGYLWRYGVEVQYSFHMGTDRWAFTPLIGFGMMKRATTRPQGSWEFGAELSYRVNNWLGFVAEGVEMERRELKDSFRFNGSLGVKFYINTDYGSKQARNGSRF